LDFRQIAYQRQIVNQLEQSDSWRRCRKRNYAMSNKRLLNAVERRGDTSWRAGGLVLPISNRPRVTSSCAGKARLRETREHTTGPNLASRDNVAHSQTLYTILETPPPLTPLCRKQARTYAIRWSDAGPAASHSGRPRCRYRVGAFRGTKRHGTSETDHSGSMPANLITFVHLSTFRR
jgi:hypothetical protein